MKTMVSLLLILATIVLFAHIILPRGSYTSVKAAKKQAHVVVGAASSNAAVEGLDVGWKKNRR
jgi:hypothetical protein